MARILLLLGGESGERDVSLASGRACAIALEGLGHEVMLLDPLQPARPLPLADFPFGQGPGQDSPELLSLTPAQVAQLVDCLCREQPALVFNCLHGGFGEDGHLAALCELLDLPLSSSPSLASALAMDKARTRQWLEGMGLPVAPGMLLPLSESAAECTGLEHLPEGTLVVKPNRMGSSVGVRMVEDRDELEEAIDEVFALGDDALVESFIPGRELTCAWVDGQILPLVEIRPRDGAWYDYQRKYSGGTEYLCPAPVEEATARQIQQWTEALNLSLGCAGATRTDWRLDPQGRAYCLEINITPGMTDKSLVPKAAAAHGWDFPALLARISAAALRG